MKKLFVRDKKLRNLIRVNDQKTRILNSISQNLNFPTLLRWKAAKINTFDKFFSSISTSNRCVNSFNKKRINKQTLFSRHIYLKLLRSGQLNGFKKSSW